MALKLEYINVIVPVDKIREKLGDKRYERQFSVITTLNWNDGRLFREGCMNHFDLEEILSDWEGRGLDLLNVKDGKKHWQDLCVVNSGHGPSYPCEWIAYDLKTNTVWLKDHAPGATVGPAGRDLPD